MRLDVEVRTVSMGDYPPLLFVSTKRPQFFIGFDTIGPLFFTLIHKRGRGELERAFSKPACVNLRKVLGPRRCFYKKR